MRNLRLINARKATGRSRVSFSNYIHVPINSYKSYEVQSKKPRPERALLILNALLELGVKCDMSIFYPEIK